MARLSMPPIIQPIKLMLKAVSLSEVVMMRDTNAGPKPFPNSSTILTNALAWPLSFGRQTFDRIDLSNGTGITTRSPLKTVTPATRVALKTCYDLSIEEL